MDKLSYEIVNSRGNIIRRNSALLTADRTGRELTAEPEDDINHTTISSSKTHATLNTPAHQNSPLSTLVAPTQCHDQPSSANELPRPVQPQVKETPVLRRSERIRNKLSG